MSKLGRVTRLVISIYPKIFLFFLGSLKNRKYDNNFTRSSDNYVCVIIIVPSQIILWSHVMNAYCGWLVASISNVHFVTRFYLAPQYKCTDYIIFGSIELEIILLIVHVCLS